MKVHSWSVVLPLVAAAALMAGVYAYHRLSQISTAPAGQTSSVSSTGFSFSANESPRELPEVPFTDGDGEPMTLSDFNGKTVLLNIWATWCVPCREEMPTLDRLQSKLGGPDFEVVALSIDQEGPPVVKKFYRELGLENLRIYVDDRIRAPALLSVIGIPATLLIDSEGREIGRKLGPADWDSDEAVAEIRRHLRAR
jgi:thiol-disulfide isomerase/thioredoxin